MMVPAELMSPRCRSLVVLRAWSGDIQNRENPCSASYERMTQVEWCSLKVSDDVAFGIYVPDKCA